MLTLFQGWALTYIERDPAIVAKQLAADKAHKHEIDEEERQRRFVEEQVRKVRDYLSSITPLPRLKKQKLCTLQLASRAHDP